jgi:hypothetical protein
MPAPAPTQHAAEGAEKKKLRRSMTEGADGNQPMVLVPPSPIYGIQLMPSKRWKVLVVDDYP